MTEYTATKTLEELAEMFVYQAHEVEVAEANRNKLTTRVAEQRYEEAVAKLDAGMTAICKAFGIGFGTFAVEIHRQVVEKYGE